MVPEPELDIFKLFPTKSYYVKRQKIFQNLVLKICFLWSRYGAGTGTFLK
jgi:hypothetical protein